MVNKLHLGSIHVFPKDCNPRITVQRKAKPFQFSKKERLLISRIAREERQTELGDGVKLSAHNVEVPNPSEVVIDVTDVMWSELLGILNSNQGDSQEEIKARGQAQVLISKNFIVTQDGYVLLSRKRELTTALNGFVDSATMVGEVDADLILATVLAELDEEYGIEGEIDMVKFHSVESLAGHVGMVSVVGSVHVPMDFGDVLESQSQAKDAWENPLIIGIENTLDGLSSACIKYGEPLAGRFQAYISRVIS